MAMADYIVYLGAQDWRHGAWRGNFYPDGLPVDWELPFYNTQFRCVYLPADVWQKAGKHEIDGWLQDTHAGFRFVLGTPSGASGEDAAGAARFGGRGVMENRIDMVRLTDTPDLRELAERMQQAAQSGMALYVISMDAALPQLMKINELMNVLGI